MRLVAHRLYARAVARPSVLLHTPAAGIHIPELRDPCGHSVRTKSTTRADTSRLETEAVRDEGASTRAPVDEGEYLSDPQSSGAGRASDEIVSDDEALEVGEEEEVFVDEEGDYYESLTGAGSNARIAHRV